MHDKMFKKILSEKLKKYHSLGQAVDWRVI